MTINIPYCYHENNHVARASELDTLAVWGGLPLGNCDMLMRTENSTQRDRRMFVEASDFEKSAIGIAAIWIVFYAVIGVATIVVHGVSSVAALH